MTYKPERQNGKSVALETRGRILLVTRAQFEAFRKHGIPADQMQIDKEIPTR